MTGVEAASLFGTTGSLVVVLVVLVLVLAMITSAVLVARARRLDRLHVRTDAAAAGLVAALDRRAAVVRAVAATAGPVALGDPERRALRAAAQDAEAAGADGDREAAENDLARRLGPLDTAALPAELAAELDDAHTRVAVARRVHNDAVRDTRALRSRRMVRYLHLAGTAPVPRYFEIAEPATGDAETTTPTGSTGTAPAPARDAARIVVLDALDRVLLFEGVDPERPAESFWFTPGGGVEPGEDPRVAAVRALRAESGLVVEPGDLAGPLWVRAVVFGHDGVTYEGREVFFSTQVADGALDGVDSSAFTEVEDRTVRGHRWWTVAELAVTVDVVHPHQLARLLADPAARRPVDPPTAIH